MGHHGQSTALIGGASLPPPSPANDPPFLHRAVGIPTSKPPQKIHNIDETKWEEGYDSDGAVGPFFDGVMDEADYNVDAEDGDLPVSMLDSDETVEAPADGDPNPPRFISDAVIIKMNVAEMKAAITQCGLKPEGKKVDLQQMLRDCMTQQLPVLEGPVENVNELSGFPVGSQRKLLSPNGTPAQEPLNFFDS